MSRCSSNKKMYITAALAEDALIEAHARNDYAKGSGPVAVYQCDDCGQFHLTSKGDLNPRLAKLMKDGTIRLSKEAFSGKENFADRRRLRFEEYSALRFFAFASLQTETKHYSE